MNQATAVDLELDQGQGKKDAAATRWRRVVEDHRVSGLPVSAFCRERGISPSSLFAWRRRLAPSGETGKFLEVTALAAAVESRPRAAADYAAAAGGDDPSIDKPPVSAMATATSEASFVELRLPGERRLIVRRGFDRQLLLDLVDALESSSSSRPTERSRRRGAS